MKERELADSLESTLGLYEHLGEEARINLEPGYNQDEVFDSQFERRAHEIQPTPTAASGIPIVPSKRGPWTGNNQLGIQRHFAPDANNRQTILKLDEWDFPKVWTLCLGLDYNADSYGSDGAITGSFGVLAEVEFGVGGVTQYVEIDWVQGATIVLPMNAVNVVASYTAVPTEIGVPALPPDLLLRANIVQGNLSQAHPTRTFEVSEDSPIIRIPPFAKSVTLYPSSAFGTGRPFEFYTGTDTVQFWGTIVGNEVIRAQPCQFTEYLDIVNELCGAPAYFTVPERARFMNFGNIDFQGGNIFAQFRIGV